MPSSVSSLVEVTGDLWTYMPPGKGPIIRCVTTNATLRTNGACVMGLGCAMEALHRFPGIDMKLGELIAAKGNHVHVLRYGGFEEHPDRPETIVSFPTKYNFRTSSIPELIEQSAQELVALAGMFPHTATFVVPRPGIGYGRLPWDTVRPILEKYFDSRFHVIKREYA